MNRSKRMQPILKLAARKEKDAANELAKSQKVLQSYKQKLETMKQYRNEYADHSSVESLPANLLRDRQAFIKQIDQTIEMLENQVAVQTTNSTNQQQQWIKTKQKTDSLDKAIDKFRLEEEKVRIQKEQLEIDDRNCKLTEHSSKH